jgi:hypothetical protein
MAENAGGVLENALEKIAGMDPAMRIDRESMLAEIEDHIEQLNQPRGRGRR